MDQMITLRWDGNQAVPHQQQEEGYSSFEDVYDKSDDSLFMQEMRNFWRDLKSISPRKIKACPVLDKKYGMWCDPQVGIVYFELLVEDRESSEGPRWGFKFFDPLGQQDEEMGASPLTPAGSKRKRSGSMTPSSSSRGGKIFAYFEESTHSPSRSNSRAGIPTDVVHGFLTIALDVRRAVMVDVQKEPLFVEKADIKIMIQVMDARINPEGQVMIFFEEENADVHARTEYRVTTELIGFRAFMHTENHNSRKLNMYWQEDPMEPQQHLCFRVDSDFALVDVFYNNAKATHRDMYLHLFSANGSWLRVYERVRYFIFIKSEFLLLDSLLTQRFKVHPRVIQLYPWQCLSTYLEATKRDTPEIVFFLDNGNDSVGVDAGGLTRQFWSEMTRSIFGKDGDPPLKRILLSENLFPYLHPRFEFLDDPMKRPYALQSILYLALMYDFSLLKKFPVCRMVNDKFFALVNVVFRYNEPNSCIESTNPNWKIDFSNVTEPPDLPLQKKRDRRRLFIEAGNLIEDRASFCGRVAHFIKHHIREKRFIGGPEEDADTEPDEDETESMLESQASVVSKGFHTYFFSALPPSAGYEDRDREAMLCEKAYLLETLQYIDGSEEIDAELNEDPYFRDAPEESQQCWIIYRKGVRALYENLGKYVGFAYYFLKACLLAKEKRNSADIDKVNWQHYETGFTRNRYTQKFNVVAIEIMKNVCVHNNFEAFSAQLQGPKLDRQKIADSIHTCNSPSVNSVVRQKTEILKDAILNPGATTEKWIEDFLYCVTGWRVLVPGDVIRIDGHGGVFCVARTCFKILEIPNHFDTPPFDEPGTSNPLTNEQRFMRNLEITMAEKTFSLQ